MFTVSLVPHSISTSPLVFLFYFSFFEICHIFSHIVLYLSLLPATSNFLLLILLFFTFLYIQLPVYHDAARLPLLSTLYPLIYTLSPPLISNFLYLPFFSSQYFDSHFLRLFYYSNYLFILISSFFNFFLLFLL